MSLDGEDLVEQDEEARRWLMDIESLRSPPPPRKLVLTSDQQQQRRHHQNHQHSNNNRQNVKTRPVNNQPIANGSVEYMNEEFVEKNGDDNGDDFITKVKQFQLSDSHPYANKGRVETAKKIAAQGGTLGLDTSKPKKVTISKQEVEALRDNVRRQTRPLNPYPSPYVSNEHNNVAGERAKNGGTNQQQLRVDVEDGGEYSSSAYSSYSSNLDTKTPNSSRKPVSPKLQHRPPVSPKVAVKLADNGSRSLVDDRELSAAFDDFDKDYQDLSRRRTFSRSPEPRPPAPPYHPPNHVRQYSSPVRHLSAADASRGRSSSMQEVAPQVQTDNYRRVTSGRRDIIVDRIPALDTRPASAQPVYHHRVPAHHQASVPGYQTPVSAHQTHVLGHHHSTSGGPAHHQTSLSGYQTSVPTSPRQTVMPTHQSLLPAYPSRISPAHQVTASGKSPTSRYATHSSSLQEQQRKFMQLEAQVEEELQYNEITIGVCHQCGEKVTNPSEATQALGHLYHARCFTCCSCDRALKGKKFYDVHGKVYCEEDYLFSGFQHEAERCAHCGHFIMDMILQAVGKSFHPTCFCCVTCKESLDGVPFTMDDQGRVYCINDYHRLFAPKCAKCAKPITPSMGRDETVRVVAMQKNYHVDCYVCEGCGLQLTDEPEKRCYPLGEHLLCHRCHIHWSRTGGAVHPITDL